MAESAPEQPNDAEPPPRGALKLLGDPAFGPYITGQWLSNTGNWFHNVERAISVHGSAGGVLIQNNQIGRADQATHSEGLTTTPLPANRPGMTGFMMFWKG